jgi:hypothetical protein
MRAHRRRLSLTRHGLPSKGALSSLGSGAVSSGSCARSVAARWASGTSFGNNQRAALHLVDVPCDASIDLLRPRVTRQTCARSALLAS